MEKLLIVSPKITQQKYNCVNNYIYVGIDIIKRKKHCYVIF